VTTVYNRDFACNIDEDGAFNVTFSAFGYSPLVSAPVRASLWQGKQRLNLEHPQLIEVVDRLDVGLPKGVTGSQIMLWMQVAALPDSHHLYWRAGVVNGSDYNLEMERVDLLHVTGEMDSLAMMGLPTAGVNTSFYGNSWQSWTYTAAYPATGRMRQTRMGALQSPQIFNPETPQPTKKGRFASDMFAVVFDRVHRRGILTGFLSQKEAFGSIEAVLSGGVPWLHVWANGDRAQLYPGGTFTTDWAMVGVVDGTQPFPMDSYVSAVAQAHGIGEPRKAPVGWCSWYMYYTHVTAQNVRDNLSTICAQQDTLPLDLVQIDDGFETQVGDWFSFLPTFPEGVARLAKEIKAARKIPGLWLAPFIVNPRSVLWKTHTDWLIKDKHGRVAQAGYNWARINGGLDLTIPEALDYACSVVRTAAHEWGFSYLKLDFLFAAALRGRYADPTRTRAQVLRMGMEAIRKAVGNETYLLGCGAPLGSVLGLVDSMRIGADVSGSWYPKFNGISLVFDQEPHFPSAVNAIQNIVTRAHLHNQWWINDPDCLLVREDTDLTLAETQTLTTTIALTGGALLLSDDLPKLTPERRRLAEVCLPVIGKRAQVPDLLDHEHPKVLRLPVEGSLGRWLLEAHINWGDKPEATIFTAPAGEGEVWMRSFWTGQIGRMQPGTEMKVMVPAHGVSLMAIRHIPAEAPAYVGSDLHISQGQEVSAFIASDAGVKVEFTLPRKCQGEVILSLPKQPAYVWVNGELADWRDLGAGMYAIRVRIEYKGRLDIVY
jgi:alpha-galactosidase